MMCRHMLVILLATSVLTDDPLQEAVVERPMTSAGKTSHAGTITAGGEEDDSRESRQIDSLLTQRQGHPGMVEMTINALNPMPYFMGGLRGVREVLKQRFFPWRGMMLDNFSRVLPRRPPMMPHRIRGFGGPGIPGSSIKFGGGPQHGGGGFGHNGDGFRGGGSNRNRFRDSITPLTTDDPSGNHHSAGGQIKKDNTEFDTPRPDTIITSSIQSDALRTDSPLHENNIQTSSIIVSTPGPPTSSISSSISVSSTPGFDEISSVTPVEKEKPKIISIEIPKEFDDLSVLEVNMKSDGKVVIGPRNLTNVESFTSPGSSHEFSPVSSHGFSGTFSSSFSPFSSHTNQHNFISHSSPQPRVTNPANIHVGVPLNSNSHRGSVACMNSLRNGNVNSIQDVLCMNNLDNAKNIHGNNINSFGNHHNSLMFNNGLPSSFARQNPVPQFSANYLQDKQNINHIYFVPLSMPSPQSSITPHFQSATSPLRENVNSVSPIRSKQSKDKDPNVFYIDITLPGNEEEDLSVRHRTKRSLQFDGWYPMDVSNPMSDEPTLGYQPPPLERVHFSDDPVDDKPMYPVRPKNPTVFVVRAEPKAPELHSVYGTENIDYYHINTQTNTIRAFRAPDQSVGAIQFVPPPQFGESNENSKLSSSSNAMSYSGSNKKFEERNSSNNESGGPIKDDLLGDIRFVNEASQYGNDYDLDMDASFSEYAPVIVRPDHYNRRDQSGFQRYRYRAVPARRRVDISDLPPSSKPDNSRTTRPALYELLGNFKYESQIEETPYLGSATDSARSSIFREVPPPNFLQNQHRYSNIDVYQKNIPRSGPRGPTYRNTGLDDYASRPWYLIDTKSERRREPSIASYIHPETRLGDERVHYKPFGPISYVSKDAGRTRHRDSIYNPHLDDHMNSYKPSTSLIANSLSELLQIFKYTHVTDRPGKGVTEEPITLIREFRYTRPTEETPTTISSFGENPRSDNKETTTSSTTGNNSPENATEAPKKVPFDAVADTNSLDGYLFSDSEASPEYAHPEVKPNIVIIEGKDIGNAKGLVKQETKLNTVTPSNLTNENTKTNTVSSKNEKQAFEALEIIYPGPALKTTTARSSSPSSSWPLYIIHEGHSKVKVFGINDTKDENPFPKNIEVLHLNEEPTTFITETYPPETTTSSPFTSTTHAITTTHILVDVNSTYVPTTTSQTTSTSSTHELRDKVVSKGADEYEYYYYDDEQLGPKISFGADYLPDGWEHPPLSLPRPPLPPTAFQFSPPVPSQRSLEGGDLLIPQGSDTYSHVFEERLPRLEDAETPESDTIPLLPAVALTRDQLSVARPVFFTKRQQRSDKKENDASVSQPFEYVSHLRQLSREKRSLNFHEDKKHADEGKRPPKSGSLA